MATAQRAPRDIIMETDAEYQRLAQKHHEYDLALQELSQSSFLNSENLAEETRLKKLKLHVKDEMERIAAQVNRARSRPPE
jgi:uncharacterized protein YdcH (DUF465 family)